MKIKKPFKIFTAVFLIILFGAFLISRNGSEPAQTTATQVVSGMDLTNYLTYSEQSLEAAKEKGTPLLFFAATSWCQSCSILEKEILERQSEIPENVTILKVDYDNDQKINAIWGVTTQHTLIQLDENGQEVNRWVGGGLDMLLKQLKK